MTKMGTVGIARAAQAAIEAGLLEADLANRFAESLDEAAMYLSIEAEEARDGITLRRAERLLALGGAIQAGVPQGT